MSAFLLDSNLFTIFLPEGILDMTKYSKYPCQDVSYNREGINRNMCHV